MIHKLIKNISQALFLAIFPHIQQKRQCEISAITALQILDNKIIE
jgi:hypothetical protein